MSGSASPYRPPNSASRRGTPFRRPGVASFNSAEYLAETERQLSQGMTFDADTNDIMPISETEAIIENIAKLMNLPLATLAERHFSETAVVNSIAMYVGQNSSTSKGHESNAFSAAFAVTDMPTAPIGKQYQILTDEPDGIIYPIARHIITVDIDGGGPVAIPKGQDGALDSDDGEGGAHEYPTTPLCRAIPAHLEECSVTPQCRVTATFGQIASSIKGVRRNGTFRQFCRSIADRIGLYWLAQKRYSNDAPKLFKTYMADERMRDIVATYDGTPWKVLDIAPYYSDPLLEWDDCDDRIHDSMLTRLREMGGNSIDAARSIDG